VSHYTEHSDRAIARTQAVAIGRARQACRARGTSVVWYAAWAFRDEVSMVRWLAREDNPWVRRKHPEWLTISVAHDLGAASVGVGETVVLARGLTFS
jgi:hypothetical protein